MCILLLCARANAHPEFNAVSTNRYLKLDLVSPGEVRLAYTIMYGAAPAFAERKRADANSDGRLDDAETQALGERLRSEVRAHLKLTIDGQPVVPELEAAAVGLAGPEVAPSPFSVDLVAHLRCPGAGPHLIVLDDTLEPPQLGETEVRVEESPSTRLLESHRGAASAGGTGPRESRILFRGPRFSALEDRSVSVRFEGNGRVARNDAPAAGGKGRIALLVVVLLALAGVVLAVVRRYRSMNG